VVARDILISAVISAITAAGVSLGLDKLRAQRGAVDVPPLVGLQPDQARALLDGRGLLLVLSEQKEDRRFQPGQIAEQKPLEGSRLHRGDSVTVALARAPSPVRVPDLRSLQLLEAKTRLESARLGIGRVDQQVNQQLAPGAVVSQGAAPGTEVQPGASIDIVVSKGPETTPVPEVVGRSLKRARETLTVAGFQVGEVRTRSDDDRSDGTILSQNPTAGSSAPRGAKVDLVVNQSE
jgi:serine/threonine-protein kinase